MPRDTEAQDDAIARAIGRTIATRREAAALTQEQLAEALGIGVQQLSRFERGAVTPSIQRLYQVADALDCRVDQLLMTSSNRQVDQEAVLEHELGGIESSDRELVTAVTRLLTTHFKSRSKKSRAR